MPERGRHRRLPSSPRSTTFIPALCLSNAKDHLLPDFYSGATGISGRFSEGLLLRRLQRAQHPSRNAVQTHGGARGHAAAVLRAAGIGRRDGHAPVTPLHHELGTKASWDPRTQLDSSSMTQVSATFERAEAL